ncbi:hypothetical protein [Brevibacillus sp. BC25]|uniref:hypothetical protein n=1 Tax=Brevibacillus sp. BC25 TaxID=1144308 RepID=UPI0002710486|nr:hypothetical protein [Brevibacillus sp. BC25]EJL20886.1 hypothetical protein PMI05_05672 [Brevibacillus sp. BC25]
MSLDEQVKVTIAVGMFLEKKEKKMTKVISNSSPIIALSMIGHLSLSNELFEEIYLPAEVFREFVESESIREHGKGELQEAVVQ